MKNRIPHLGFIIEKGQRLRKGNDFPSGLATAEPPTGMIKPKRPVVQTMLLHERAGEISGDVQVHQGVSVGMAAQVSIGRWIARKTEA